MNFQAKFTRPRGFLKFRNNPEPSDLSNKKLNFQLWRVKFDTPQILYAKTKFSN